MRFVGKTSQGVTICFTLGRDAKRFLELGFAFRTPCSTRIGVVAYDGPPKSPALPLRPDGSFSFSDIGVYVLPVGVPAKNYVFGTANVDNTLFQGKLSRTKQSAAGSLREKPEPSFSEPPCDSGKVSWTARRVAG